MALAPLALPHQSSPDRYGGGVRLINCYPEQAGAEGKIPFPLVGSDGLSLFSTLDGGGKGRGAITLGSFLYVVSGRAVFKVDQNGASTFIGGFSGDDPVYMSRNQKSPDPQIMLASNGKRAIIENDVLSQITDPDLEPPNSVVFMNQRFITTTASGRFQWSELSEGNDWDALDFATAEFDADGLNRALVRRSELLLFGPKTIEPWYAPTTGLSVFAPAGSVVERGCLNGATVATLEERPFFVADDETVRVLEGYSAIRVSSHGVERSIRDTSSQAEMAAFGYAKDGHSFYVLVGTDFTWIYDATTGFWHERQSYDLNRWRAQVYAKFAGLHIVTDDENGLLYSIDNTVFDENGDYLIMRAEVPVHAFPRKVRVDDLRIDTIPGEGRNSPDIHDSDPKAIIDVSRDGGKSFAGTRHYPMGKVGEYKRQVRANRFGSSNEDGFVFGVSVSAGVARGITAMSADLKVLSN